MSDALDKIRSKIDELDNQIQSLITERARCAQEVAKIKQQSGNTGSVYRPEREANILREVMQRNDGPLSDEEMARLFREIMSACLALQEPMRIAYLGPEGTYTQAATLKHFGHSVVTAPMAAIDEIFREVESGSAVYGIVPIENSTEGVVNHTLDMFINSPLKICGEVELRINHHLLSDAADLSEIEEVVTHQQSLAQCREWLNANLPNVKRTAVGSNAQAAKLAKQNKKVAAIAGLTASEIYDLKLLASNIEDEPNNTTRFLVIGGHSSPATGNDKTSIMISAKNEPGALHSLLKPFADNEQTMTRIESRPSRRGTWEYVFFLDIEGHADDIPLARALRALEKEAAVLKILGSYPKAIL